MQEDLWLLLSYVSSSGLMLWLMVKFYRQQPFSFHLLFSAIYLVTFFGGLPFSMVMKWYFEANLPSSQYLMFALVMALIGYVIYYLCYALSAYCFQSHSPKQAVSFTKKSANLTACLLAFVACGTLIYFIAVNGLLLFSLEKYSQIFSPLVNAVALKRFFYFFLPALLIYYFVSPSKKRWFYFLVLGVGFGILSYMAVGGTRANLALAVMLFLLIGIYHRYISLRWLFLSGIIGVAVMFGLALARYNLNVQGKEAWFTFLYLTRDTFSPWENLAKIFSFEIEYQGLMPIVRDFYVFIPQSLWAERPDIAWNTANYFTKVLLGNQSGLAISPTLIGSFYLMGGVPFIVVGMAAIGIVMRVFDKIFIDGKFSPVVQAYCLGNLFNFIVLVREGVDAFVSRFVFFSVIFTACWLVAKLIYIRKEK